MRSAPKKELKTDEEPVACDICGRTILKGERTEPFLAPGGRRKTVCELCIPRADHEGWIRESAQNDIPATRTRPQQRRSFVGRLRGMLDGEEHAPEARDLEPPPTFDHEPPPRREREPEPARTSRREARHIRAVPTTAEVKVDRALELFNSSDHPRTIAGIARTLGTPWVHTSPDAAAPSEVTVVVAWELSWYRYRVDLGDADEPILLLEKGDELAELEEPLRDWNALADENGHLAAM
ncbi:MAG: hypothetical protein QOJ29_3458 [Thermoleophilaceae bacterium]|jgi:hypothetical protein|nr:hypothetical protein [Thermoleophilaceae bacterium]